MRDIDGRARVVTGRCLHYGEGITYWPLVEVLLQLDADAEAVLGMPTPAEAAVATRHVLEQEALERPLVVTRGEPIMLSDRSGPPPPDNPHAHGVIPKVVPPLPRENPHARDLPWHTAFAWLRAGWSDTMIDPMPSLLYGVGVFLVSVLVVGCSTGSSSTIFSFPRSPASWSWVR